MRAIRPFRSLTFRTATGCNTYVSGPSNAPTMDFRNCAVGGDCRGNTLGGSRPVAVGHDSRLSGGSVDCILYGRNVLCFADGTERERCCKAWAHRTCPRYSIYRELLILSVNLLNCTVLINMAHSQHLRTFREICHGKRIGSPI